MPRSFINCTTAESGASGVVVMGSTTMPLSCFFTFATSIAEENALISSGSSAGFGIRLFYDTAANRVFVTEAFEGANGLAAGLDRGTEITAIGTSISSARKRR